MNHDDLLKWSARAADWARDYHAHLREQPVRPDVTPGSIRAALPDIAPESPESMEQIFADFEALVPGAMTHWQHPRFFAYFPANASPASMLAEQLANAIGAQCMLWQTSPAATEIEERMVQWLAAALGLPEGFAGTIHDSATTATLCAVLTMRERALDWQGLTGGLSGQPGLRIYASAQTHSSVDKAARLAGIGQDNLVKIPTRDDLSMDPEALSAAIRADRAAGHLPAGVVFCSGGTSVGAFDDIAACLPVARAEGLYTHVDAAWAGSAMICEEFRPLWAGAGDCDSIVFNPHKWLGVQFDCAVQFLRDPGQQIRTMGLRPEYLETLESTGITDFNEWTVPLGRRFRALKLWFVLRAYGLEGLRDRLRNHVAWVAELAERVAAIPDLEVVTEPRLALFSFAHRDGDAVTEALIRKVNADGRVYLTQTRHAGRFVIRMSAGSFDCTRDDVLMVETVLREVLG
ncbi:aspartate aminotransferase family protein [Rhodobacteraceae bacterium W635]|uniref:pyridoxal phosphate-dependent decarboxylase family protein n=1 Tax=Nioella halotolerans TaxID=2303578 RepID=UPI000E3C5A9D|nr:aspartate aminotransferase family protein [Rhodobacteraceae bacterium W635]